MVNPSGALQLNIFGGSGYTSILGTTSLFMKSDFSSGNMDLIIKNNPDNSGKIIHSNNWDLSLASRSRVNDYSNADITYDITDYSSNKFDLYYDRNRGQEGVSYQIGLTQSINDIAIKPNVMAVANKDWTSFEKYTSTFTGNMVSAYMSPINYYGIGGEPVSYLAYHIRYEWVVASPYCLSSGGLLTITYDYGETTQNLDITVPAYPPGGGGTGLIYSTSPTVSVSYAGDPPSYPSIPFGCFQQTVIGSSIVEISTTIPPPTGAIVRGGGYIVPSELDPKLTNFLLPAMTPYFKDQNFNWMNYNSPNEFEVPDYSDIYLRIKYDNSSGPYDNYIYNTSPLADEKIYKFGGFIRIADWLNGLLDAAVLDDKLTIDGEEYLWYIIVENDGSYYSVGLSNYVTWDYLYANDQTPDEFYLLAYGGYEPVALKYISNFGIEIVKVAAFPRCGKVDVYFHKVGDIESFTAGTNIVYSAGHGLSTGDVIKITGGLGSGSTINGNRVAYVVDGNTFGLYYDLSFLYPAMINNTSSGPGIRFTTVEGETWKYGFTLYSPCGKNGYGLSKILRTTQESPAAFESPIENAIETDVRENFIMRSHSSLRGERSWSNFYPFERFSEIEGVAFDVINGNKFGSSVDMRVYGDDYILAVGESGATESFEIISSFATLTNQVLPQNQKVVPNYLPYGRIHFFKLLTDSKTIEYITTVESADNPWVAYEALNRANRVSTAITTMENMPITNNGLISYNNTLSNYWNGARYMHWGQSYYFDSDLQLNFPDQNQFLNHYGFVDSLGKSLSFEVNGDTIYCISSADVKNADFENNLRIDNVDRYLKTVYFDLNTPDDQYSSLISIADTDFTSPDLNIQKSEIQKFSNHIRMDKGRVVAGWASDYKDNEYIYYFSRNGDDYTHIQTISHVGNYGFGNLISISDEMMVSNDSSSVYAYKFDTLGNQYYQASSFLASINSFDIYRDTLVTRDNDSYNGYQFNHSTNEYVVKFAVESPRTSDSSVVKISPSDGAAFYDKRERGSSSISYDSTAETVSGFFAFSYFTYTTYGLTVVTSTATVIPGDEVILSTSYDQGQFSKALVVVDASTVNELSLNNYLMTMDTHNLDYLSLFIKTTEGSPTGDLPLNIWGNTSSTGMMDLYILPPAIASGSMELFVKQLTVIETGIPLHIRSTFSSGELPLIINGSTGYTLPLFLEAMPPVATGYGVTPLYINSIYGTDPNVSGSLNLTMYSPQSATVTGNMNLYIRENTGSSTGGLSLYINPDGVSGISFNNTTLFMTSSGYQRYGYSEGMNLVIQRPESVMMPLIVYNTTTQGNIPMYVSGAYGYSATMPLVCSGSHTPHSSIQLFVRGDL